MIRLTCGALLAVLVLTCGRSQAGPVQSGFNDAFGINADGFVNNSPFQLGASLDGQGGAESGWATPWRLGGGAIVGTTAFEGDGAAAFFANTASAERIMSQAPTGPFSVSVRLMIPATITRSVLFRVADSTIADTFESIATQWLVGPDFFLYAVDGIEDSCQTGDCGLENTGLQLQPGVWHEVLAMIDPTSRTWELFLDGNRYNAPDSLGFRGRPTRLDRLEYLNEIAAPDGSYLDAVVITSSSSLAVPEPSSLAIVLVAGLALFAKRKVTDHHKLLC